MRNRAMAGVFLAAVATATVASQPAGQSTAFLPIDDVRPGMNGIGRTVFAGDTI